MYLNTKCIVLQNVNVQIFNHEVKNFELDNFHFVKIQYSSSIPPGGGKNGIVHNRGMGGNVNNRIKKELNMRMLILGVWADSGSWAQWRMNTVSRYPNMERYDKTGLKLSADLLICRALAARVVVCLCWETPVYTPHSSPSRQTRWTPSLRSYACWA